MPDTVQTDSLQEPIIPSDNLTQWVTISDDSSDACEGEHRYLEHFFVSQNNHDIALSRLFAENFHPVFRNVSIAGKFVFPRNKYHFPLGVSFVNVTFESDIDLSGVHFNGPAYFWHCTFRKDFNISRSRVSNDGPPIANRTPGEVNFSYCHFDSKPEFNRAEFHGQAHFHRTVFRNGARFEGTRFLGGSIFKSLGSDVCISLLQIAALLEGKDSSTAQHGSVAKQVTDKLEAEHLLIRNADYRTDHWDFAPDCALLAPSLQTRIKNALLTGPKIQATFAQELALFWADAYHALMFPRTEDHQYTSDSASSFRNADFGSFTAFRHVNLSSCFFLGCHLNKVEFTVVEWDRKFLGFPFLPKRLLSKRAALHDETAIPASEETSTTRSDLSELYQELRVAYDNEGDRLRARDFYFGELEMDRLSRNWFVRHISLAYLYKVSAGYSRCEGRALAWLLVFLLLLFPLSYCWLGKEEHAILAGRASEIQSEAASPARGASSNDRLFHDQDRLARSDYAVWGNGKTLLVMRGVAASLQASTFLPTTGEVSNTSAAEEALLPDRCAGFSGQKCADAFRQFSRWEAVRRFIEATERLVILAQLGLFLVSLRSRFQRG